MNLYRFYKFTVFGKQKGKETFAQGPLKEVISSQICPWPDFGAGESAGGRNPAPVVAGGEGPVGEKLEGVETYRFVGSVGAGGCRRGVAVGVGVGAAVSSRPRRCSGSLGGRGCRGRGL